MFRSRVLKAGATAFALAVAPGVAQGATPDSWRVGPDMNVGQPNAVAATLNDGRVLFIGGAVTASSTTVEAYSPASDSIATVTPMHAARTKPLAVTLTDGRVLVAGGVNNSDTSAEIYDPVANSWAAISDPTRAVRSVGVSVASNGAAAALPGGEALLAGGVATGTTTPTATADVFDPTLHSGAGGFKAAHDMTTPRAAEGAAPLPGGRVLVVGGSSTGSDVLASGEVYDPSTNTWTSVGNDLAVGRLLPDLAPLPDGRVLIFGGVSGTGPSDAAVPADSEIYDPATNVFTQTGPMVPGVVEASFGVLPDGRVVSAGGEAVASGLNPRFGGTQVYEPNVNGWVRAAPPIGLVLGATAATLPSGELLALKVDSGIGLGQSTGTQIYTPATAPSVPTAVSAQPGDGNALVSWSPAAANGRPITHYTVRASTGATVTTADGRSQATIAVPNGVPVTFTVTATNDVGTSGESAPSTAVTASAAAKPDTTAPTITITGLKSKLKRKSFLKALTATITPSEASSLAITLYGSAKRATIAKAYNVVLASKTYGRSASARKLKLKPNKKLVGHARRFTVRLKIVATDAAGNTRTVTKTIKVS